MKHIFQLLFVFLFVASANASSSDNDLSRKFETLRDLFQNDAPITIDRVPHTREEAKVEPCRFHPDRSMRQIRLEFTSQVYRGVECRHKALMLLPYPEIPRSAKGTAAIILGGGIFPAKDIEHDWIESVVVDLGIPCLVIQNALNPKAFGARNQGELMSFGNRTFFETGDPREAGYYALARIFSAAATVAEHLPELNAKRFITTGSSKGGMASLIACGGDSRIVGSFPTAWNAGNATRFLQLKGQRWGWDVKPKETGPAGETARSAIGNLSTPRGREYFRLFDPHEWGTLLEGKFVMPAVGTNDPLFHLLTDQFYFDELKCKRAFLRVPNYGHGRLASQHATAWKFTVAAALLDRRVPSIRVEARRENGKAVILATVRNISRIQGLRLFYATDATGDYRRAKWRSRKVNQIPTIGRRTSIATLELPSRGVLAVFAQLIDENDQCRGIISSNIVEVGDPILQPLNQ
ncbi:MAG: hypothetical protein GY774_18980 [Planctomycetes bacterium]|nr:hypothetical protein [Planctomycetota bacterium]